MKFPINVPNENYTLKESNSKAQKLHTEEQVGKNTSGVVLLRTCTTRTIVRAF